MINVTISHNVSGFRGLVGHDALVVNLKHTCLVS